MEDNQKCCDYEVSMLQKQFDEIVSKLDKIKIHLETELREGSVRKNAKVSETKLDLEKKSKQIKDYVKFLEEKHSTMSDYCLIDNHRDLMTNLKSNKDSDKEKGDFPARYRGGVINEGILESMMGQTLDLDDITVTETDSFQYGDKSIVVLEAIKKDTCFVGGLISGYIEKVDKRNKKEMIINVNVNDVCVTDNGDVYATDYDSDSIVRLSPSGSVSKVFRTAPLVPRGIGRFKEGGLLVTLRDNPSEEFQPDSDSRRLVIHVTFTGDLIREYEYHEDGQTRLFILPWRVRQNNNTDICVVNRASMAAGELVILSSSGFLKSIYQGKNQGFQFNPIDLVCDSHCNLIVSDSINSQVHLVSPEGEFMKYLLTENEITKPCSMSLYKSTLWVNQKRIPRSIRPYFPAPRLVAHLSRDWDISLCLIQCSYKIPIPWNETRNQVLDESLAIPETSQAKERVVIHSKMLKKTLKSENKTDLALCLSSV
uniref:Tripartite motif-containing protein 2 n=1 Tax=Magallana gigas TaxID=29159 RepID=A0A8W8IJJ6_MAGGI